ncbi:MAG: hypothetical protein QF442_01420 [Candidatus Peribacteraceae bacterium]|nr:hypothetical protein [Candidatus Peribacteraceae bacterium]
MGNNFPHYLMPATEEPPVLDAQAVAPDATATPEISEATTDFKIESHRFEALSNMYKGFDRLANRYNDEYEVTHEG